jgi:hypothetical protein
MKVVSVCMATLSLGGLVGSRGRYVLVDPTHRRFSSASDGLIVRVERFQVEKALGLGFHPTERRYRNLRLKSPALQRLGSATEHVIAIERSVFGLFHDA